MESKKKKTGREIGLKLMKLREQEGWSQTEMAGRLGVTPSAYHKNEKGENTPCIETLHRLWGKLGISMNWLFFDDGPKYRKDSGGREQELAKEVETLKQERAAAIVGKPEVRELLECMERVPMLYHDIMLRFQQFKIDRKELLSPTAQVEIRDRHP